MLQRFLFSGRFYPFAIVWFVVQTLQAMLTPIHSDEAYYRMYALHLDWGYFDHPPLVALGIALGSWLPGTLGVRFATLFLQYGTLWLLFDLIRLRSPKALQVFWPMVLLLPLLHIYGFIATPDAPLLFCTALFFWLLHHLVLQPRWWVFASLGVCMALCAYGKYHAVLVLGFAALSHRWYWKQAGWYVAVLLSLLLFLPHLVWQYQHDWPTLRYHLAERRGESLWYHQLEYAGNLILVFHPFLLYYLWKTRSKPTDVVEYSAWGVLLGMVVFFSFQTLRDHVQPQWMIGALVPFILLIAQAVQQAKQIHQRPWRVAVMASLPIFLFLRLALVVDMLPDHLGVHRKVALTSAIASAAQNLPVVAINSYQRASAYAWYQNKPGTHALHTLGSRKSQYSIWMLDTALHEKEVFLIGDRFSPIALDSIDGELFGKRTRFYCYEKLQFKDIRTELRADSSFHITGACYNPYPFALRTDSLQVLFTELSQGKPLGTPLALNWVQGGNLPSGGTALFVGVVPQRLTDATGFGLAPARVGWPGGSMIWVGE